MFRTNDGGTTWDQQDSHTEQNLRNVQFLDENTGYVVGDGGTILVTNNGGQRAGGPSTLAHSSTCGVCFLPTGRWVSRWVMVERSSRR
jgi:hypothetical protein